MEPESSVDILMATYNGQKYVRDQLNSVRTQTHVAWRLLIRDDGSNDSTLAICRAAAADDNRIVIVEDQLGNLGFNRNYFKLLSLSTAPYSMFCDQDDVWLEGKVEETLKVARRTERQSQGVPVMVHCDSVVTDSALFVMGKTLVGNRAKHTGLRAVLMANPAQGATIMVNAKLRKLVLLQEPQLPYDYQACLIAEATGRRVFIPATLMMYRQHDSNAIGVNTVVRQGAKKPNDKPKLSPTLALALDGVHAIEKTLGPVKAHWNSGVEAELVRVSRLLSSQFSIARVYYAFVGGYQFYRRKDRLNLILFALGLSSLPN